MAKRILIPTDFSIDSLNVLKTFLQQDTTQEQYDVLLSCGYYLSESITDLLFFSKYKILRGLDTESFMDAVSIIQNKYANTLRSVRVDLFTGSVQSGFEDYVAGQRIDTIVYPANANFSPVFKKSFDLKKYILKTKKPKVSIDHKTSDQSNGANDIAALFNNTVGSYS